MPAPSNRTGIPATLVVLLLAAILLAGFVVGPRVFEFDAWPQPSRQDRVEEVVARSADEATEVPIVRVRRDPRSRGRDDAVSVRGRNGRRRGGSDRPELSVRSDGAREAAPHRDGGRAGARGGSGGAPTETPAPDVVIVEDAPPARPDAPVGEPEQPTQLAELAEPQAPVLRPDAEQVPETPLPAPDERDESRIVEVDAGALIDEVEGLLGGLLPGERRGRHGHR
jgi:hypothetical protein